jgi:hypothetical protein
VSCQLKAETLPVGLYVGTTAVMTAVSAEPVGSTEVATALERMRTSAGFKTQVVPSRHP